MFREFIINKIGKKNAIQWICGRQWKQLFSSSALDLLQPFCSKAVHGTLHTRSIFNWVKQFLITYDLRKVSLTVFQETSGCILVCIYHCVLSMTNWYNHISLLKNSGVYWNKGLSVNSTLRPMVFFILFCLYRNFHDEFLSSWSFGESIKYWNYNFFYSSREASKEVSRSKKLKEELRNSMILLMKQI